MLKKFYFKRLFFSLIIVEVLFILFLLINSSFASFHCVGCNVLLITYDSLRPDHMGIYGYYRNTAPTLDLLAQDSAVFTNYFVTAPVTFVSLPSLMSGLRPSVNISLIDEEINNTALRYFFLPNKTLTLAEILSSNAYSTHAFINNAVAHTNYLQGFENLFVHDLIDDYLIAEELVDFFDSFNSSNGPFFVWVHFFLPHAPYLPPFPFNETFLDENINYSNKINCSQLSDSHKLESELIKFNNSYCSDNGSISKDFLVSQYDGYVLYGDFLFSLLLSSLESNSLFNDTLIVFSSDHGESFGEHIFEGRESFGNHGSLFDSDLRVPLLFFNPRSRQGFVFSDLLSSVDFFPTLLDVLGLSFDSSLVHGSSFFDLFLGKNIFPRIAFSIGYGYDLSYRTQNWKYIFSSDTEFLFYLLDDPGESNNLIGQYDSLKDFIPHILVRKIELVRKLVNIS